MNEDFFIRIKASIAEAEKALDDIKDAVSEVGTETKKTDKNLQNAEKQVKNLGSTGKVNLTALKQLTKGWGDDVIDVAEAIANSGVQVKLLGGLVGAVAISALAVASAGVLLYWDEIKEAATGVNSELERQGERALENKQNAENELKIFRAREPVLALQGKTEKEILELRKQQLQKVFDTTKAELNLAKTQLENLDNYYKGLLEFARTIVGVFAVPLKAVAEQFDAIFGTDTAAKIDRLAGRAVNFITSWTGIEDQKKKVKDLELALAELEGQLASTTMGIQALTRGKVEKVPIVEGIVQGVKDLTSTIGLASNGIESLEKQVNSFAVDAFLKRMEQAQMSAKAVVAGVTSGIRDLFNQLYTSFQTGNAIIDAALNTVITIFEQLITSMIGAFITEKIIGKARIAGAQSLSNANAITAATTTAAALPFGVFALPGLITGALATVNGFFAGLTSFASGGFSGDRNLVRVNANELILNPNQQATLYNLLRGAVPSTAARMPTQTNQEQNLTTRVRGSDLVLLMERAKKKTSRFG